ncbi:MAG: oxidoreductase [Chitinophagales bacterium]|nr:MAG: oxidoreductase [Chitinophagales bacterium]
MIDNSAIDLTDEADFVIVGCGAAGAVCAWWLTAAGKSVILIEEGPPPRPAPGDALEALSTLYRDGGALAAIGEDVMPLLQGRCIGGSTYINGAIQIPFPEKIWQEWVEQDSKWKRLLPWEVLLDAQQWVTDILHVEKTPTHLLGNNGGTMLRVLGSRAEPISRNVKDCQGRGRCLQGCPVQAKQSVDVALIPQAIARGARVYARCEVKKIVVSQRRATGVKARFESGKKLQAHARKAVIMAASAIQTPWLLLSSGIRFYGNGFQCHPGAAMAGLFPHAIFGMPEATQSVHSLHWSEENIKLESLGMPRAFRAARVPGAGKVLAARLQKLDQVALWGVACRAEARGKVLRGPAGPLVYYTLTPRDRQKLLYGLSILAEAMLEAGAQEVWPSVYGAPESITSRQQARAIRQMKPLGGMIPMVATHFFCGVHVREKFQVEGVDGLVIADSSLFPSNIGVNPMTSIMAVAAVVAQSWSEE